MEVLGGLKVELLRRRMTQRQLARLLAAEGEAISESQISRFIRGDVWCPARLRKLIAGCLGSPTESLFPGQPLCKGAFKRRNDLRKPKTVRGENQVSSDPVGADQP